MGTKTPILVVDDLPANLLVFEAVLDSSVYEIVCVASGEQALAQLETQDFALVLLDFRLPTLDGIATAQRLRVRGRELGRRAPVIFVTAGEIDHAQLLTAYASGAVDFIQKPFVPEVLSAKVAVFAALYQARRLSNERLEKFQKEQQHAQEESRRFELLVESVKDYAIFILDPTGVVSTWNSGAERIKGYAARDIIGKHFSVFYPPEVAATDKCELELAIATREGRFEEEGWRIRQDGSRIWANVTITALRAPSGVLVGFAKVTRDLTERMRHEETLRVLAAETAALAEKARVQEFQERFIGVLGHDLRNPLAAIDMGTSLVEQRAEQTDDHAMKRVAGRMKASTQRMTRMIEQILDLTRIRLGGGLESRPATMDLSRTLIAVVEELRIANPTRMFDVHCAPSVTGVWDRDRLEQLFSNVVGNALHHGDPEQPIRIDVAESEKEVVIGIQNQGTPIPEALQAELFNPFRRGERDSRTSKTAGLGLGLYISREIALAHTGSIDVASSPREGTTFRVKLPRTPDTLQVKK